MGKKTPSYELILGSASFLNPFFNSKIFISNQLMKSVEKYIKNEIYLLGDVKSGMSSQVKQNDDSIFHELYDDSEDDTDEFEKWKKITLNLEK